jgi:hypothetical protein
MRVHDVVFVREWSFTHAALTTPYRKWKRTSCKSFVSAIMVGVPTLSSNTLIL